MMSKTQPNLNTKWTRKTSPDKREDLEKLIRNSTIVLSRLKDIVEEDLVEMDKVSLSDYESPSWSHKQAHENGKKEYARQLLTLLSFLEQRK